MGSKLKKDRAKKRKLDEEPRKVEISAPKKKCEQEEEAATSSDDRQREILPTREAVARQVSVYVQQKELTLIEGPIGCGKSFLGAHIAEKLLLKLRCMQMGDQVDSKSIFGSYHCTEVAGQFQWKQSNLTQWLTEPSLILLEDIDLANSDVITIFREITKSRRILLPNGESVPFHEKARILATTSGKGKKNSLLEKICRVQLDALSDKELERLVLQSFPRCSDLRKTLIAIFRTIEAFPATGNSRSLTSSDFLRACSRLNRLANHSEPLHLFAELVDCWALSELPDRAFVLCEKIAGRLSVTPDQVSSHLKMRQPSFSHDDYHCQIGRCRLPRAPSLKVMLHHKLGHTRDVLQLMERIAVCVRETESVLLVGETGVGKTSVVQDLASKLNVTLKVVNLSPTSDSDELLEGYKPTSIGTLMEPFTKFYHEVFTASLNAQQNGKFLDSLESCLNTGRYRDYLSLAEKTALKVLMGKGEIDPRWAEVVVRARKIRDGIEKNAVPFAITRGAVLEAVQNGYWLLVDEINLAPPECLDAIVHAISSPDAHPNFRLFACMNPATDAGKRRLPTSVRTRFTEFYVSEMSDPYQLALVVNAYMPSMKDTAVERLVSFYLLAKKEYPSSYSLRTFCRALLFAADDRFGSEERNVYEAVSMAFLTNLDSDEKIKMKTKILQTFKVATTVALPEPTSTSPEQRFVKVEGYWIECGTVLPKVEESYVLTKTVKENLAEIARIISSGRFPVLLEGETSAGKTAIVTYLGRATGNEVIRINNHEHTDIQEYMGSYVAGEEGRLVFAEGALVKAVRNGSWVILDELNLAPTDVIESLNRLLDDNRELFIPELNKTIKAHPRFRLFATQNPAGTYSGRKKLSRALLSRFVVLKFHHLPMNELAQMVEKRCKIHLSAAEKMISVLVELRNKRSLSGLFSARDGLMTLRDVFRWARRLSDDPQQDWLQVLVDHGYFLLAGRCRDKKDELTVSETLEKVLKRKIEPETLYAETSPYFPVNIDTQKIVLTYGMRRMLVLTEQAWKHNEAVLMVGETGGGKTSLAETMGRGGLLTINCHERTETADLLGRLRPRDGGGFEWSDGVVISAMKAGAPLLVDEISLAEDSVLERLNPLFEEDRSLLLSDAGVEVHSVQAQAGYQMIATMNPGGDYGKKELSKALRNRFTEVWSSSEYKKNELVSIFDNRLRGIEAAATLPRPTEAAQVVIDWIGEFFSKYAHVFRHAPSVRDIVACADLFGSMLSNSLPVSSAVKEALCAVFLDALESLPTRMAIDSEGILDDADRILNRLLGTQTPSNKVVEKRQVQLHGDRITIGWISVPFGTVQPTRPKTFSLKAPTCVTNFYRIARGLLINKPILLEGPPGCGKSSTVMAMAQLTGNAITRLNLSDQTDLSDLFGSDVPVVLEDGSISFRWEDGPVLRAIKRGEWILLDEMNLASQSVLEGLNACFDHRRVLYIAELNKSFEIPADSRCRFFACQNPRAQGGNRRALPKSFVNRFTSIWVDDLTKDDITFILLEVDEKKVLSHTQIHAMVEITYRLSQEHHLHGGPFTFNLRDLLRWLQLYSETNNMSAAYHLLFVSRMRREEDRVKLAGMYQELFLEPCIPPPASLFADSDRVMIGAVTLPRNAAATSTSSSCLFTSQTPLMTKLAACVRMHWLALVVGPRGCGKQTTIENLAQICGVRLEKISLTAETDAQELIGSYEQVIDETALSRAKAEITNALQGKIDEATIKKLRYAEELLELEIATELAMSQVKEDQYLVEKCRLEIQQAARADMRFSWIDSAFVKAFLEGHWLVIENVNMCSAAVLDRLNSCLENEGKLVISERQASFEPLEPHPNFRVFLTMDAKDGEISRAMRNRSVEIYMDDLWSTTECDSTTLATLAGQEIPKQISEALIHYPAETQLQFCILLREMRVEEACRQLNIHFEEEIESKEQLICCPRVSELQTDEFLKWILRQWRPEHGDLINRAFLCTLAASTKMLASETYRSCFRDIGNRFAARLAGLCLPDSSIPIDSRFLGRRVAADEAEAVALRKIVDMTVAEWALTAVLSVRREDGSAEHLGQTLRKYELMHHPRSFRNIDYLANFAEAVQDCLKSGIFGPESRVYLFCLSLLLLVKTIRTELTDRAGGAPVYLAYNYLESIEGVEFTSGQMLEKLLHDVGQFWKAEAHQQFIKNYMSLYEQHRLVNAFETEEDCQRLKSVVAPYETGEYEPMEEEPIQESAIVSSLKLAKKAELILASLKCLTIDKTDSIFTAQKPLLMLNWTDPLYQHNSHLLALLTAQIESGSSMPVLSLPKKGTFSFVYTSFWESLDFDVNMSSLTIRDLQDLTLNAFIEKMWRLAANGQLLDESVSETLAAVPRTLQGWATSDVPGWRGRLDCALEVMQMAMPPHLTIDPIIYEEEKVRYLTRKLELVDHQLQILSQWRRGIAKQDPECDRDSAHPILATLYSTRAHLLEELDCCLTNEQPVYRQNARLYADLCSEMNDFYQVSQDVASKMTRDVEGADQIRLLHAQLSSFIVSVASFRQNILSKFTSFVDVSMAFLTAVEILFSAAMELLSQLEVRERSLELHSSVFPVIYELRNSREGVVSSEILAWSCRDSSPMPLRLKAAVVRRRLLEQTDPTVDLEWARREWRKWYERNVAKKAEKEYVYRDKTEEEKDERELEEFFEAVKQEQEILPPEDVCQLLNAGAKQDQTREHEGKEAEARYSMALTWIRHLLTQLHQLGEKYRNSSISSDLLMAKWVSQREATPPGGVLDVYRSASIAEFRKAGRLLEALVTRVKEVQERWPEITTFKEILASVDQFLSSTITTTHRKMAVEMESVIANCEAWEKNSDREHSLLKQLSPLRELLVEWKKMEIRSWSHLLDRTEGDAVLSAQLVAFPLFDALFLAQDDESHANIVAMSADWLHNGTLLDFPARLRSVKTLSEWAGMLEKETLSFKLMSLTAHFEQYAPLVEKNFKEQRSVAEQSLNDYIRIAKFNDLNLENIQAQSAKSHAHLFKIIKKFKANTLTEASTHFDTLLDIEKWTNVAEIEKKLVAEGEGQKRVKRAKELSEALIGKAVEVADLTPIRELTEQAEGCNEQLRTNVNYDQYTEDEEKEKAQGYARNCRQRDVAMLIKEAQAVGLNARRAVTLNQEKLTQQSITGVRVQSHQEALIRVCSGGRNVCIKRANQVNQQLSVATRKHFSGLIEYGMSWMLKVHWRLDSSTAQLEHLDAMVVALDRVDKNVQADWSIDHDQMKDRLHLAAERASELVSAVEAMKIRIDLVPQSEDQVDATVSQHLHPLSLLHSAHPAVEDLKKNTSHAYELAKSISGAMEQLGKSAVGGAFERAAFGEVETRLAMDSSDLLNTLAELKEWFAEETAQSEQLVEAVKQHFEVKNSETAAKEVPTEPILLLIQSLYKAVAEKNDWEELRLIDRFDAVSQLLCSGKLEEVIWWLQSVVSDALVGILPSNLSELVPLASIASQLVAKLFAHSSSVLQSVAVLYNRLLAVTQQLFEKGYVNTLPKEGKQESGDGHTDEVGEGGGMGEGKAGGEAKDVTEEMEETGQIEGLQDEEQEPPSGDKGQNEKPIEMDEDFAEDLQDIDKEEKGNDEPEEEDQEDEEPNPEDQMGDVDEADDTQLDPKLWDEEEKDDERKETDQDDAGADNKTDEMAAKEDDPLAAQQQEKPDDQPAPGEEEKEEEELENVDEREREGQEDETKGEEIDKDQMDQNDEGGDEINMDEQMDVDETDKEDEEEQVDGKAEDDAEEVETEEDNADEAELNENPGEEEPHEEEDAEAMEQGTGGQRRDKDAEKNEGGANEDEEDEEQDEDEGKGESKSDQKGEKGQGAEAKEKEEAAEQDEEAEEEEQAQKERQLATEDEEVVEAEEGQGEENEVGQQMEDSAAAQRQMLGAGSMEEAKKSRKEEEQKKKEDLPKKRKPLPGGEEVMDVPAEEGDGVKEEAQAAIHLAPEDMFKLAEEITNELVLGEASTSSDEKSPSDEREEKKTSRADAEKMWTEICRSVNILSTELAENLRLILEPQRASKMQGDYRTGKRLNMRRLIPYIASEYRKDRIWMRRTKRAQRDYQVLIAVDDSASMNENGIHQVTCESVCAIDDALRRCDAGAVSVVSFGSQVKTICAFGDQITPGPEFIEKMSFDQSSTDLLALLSKSRHMLADARTVTSEQLLIIISDGRGALAQGAEKVKQAVAALQSVTVLFVILDSGTKSISELSVASFKSGSVVLTPYLSLFPFPFYAVVKSVRQLPSVLAESIRQWFELSVQSS